ncbi:MAG: DUF2971 domain-containing protein [Negativicutes bacterium]|nr:DUF2971 domain-containing protein [Negativicutes bacterium]
MDLFKYCAWSGSAGSHTRDNLRDSAIYLSPPDSFNDPFEFNPVVDIAAEDETFVKALVKEFQQLHHCSQVEAKRAILEQLKANPRLNTPAARRETALATKEYLRRTHGVCCFTTKSDNPAMWAHYADYHQGVCIHYDFAKNSPVRLPAEKESRISVTLRSVTYSEERPIARFFSPDLAATMFDSLLTKSPDWSYENEYRMIAQGYTGKGHYAPDSLVSIIIGYRMPPEEREEVRAFSRQLPVPPRLFVAEINSRKFSYDIRPL